MALGEDVLAGASAPWRSDYNSLKDAAAGDVEAQRARANKAYEELVGYTSDADITVIGWVEAITYARLAAAHGHAHDGQVLAFLLAQFADWQREQGRGDIATGFEAAGLNLASRLADAGDDNFADMIERAAELLNADTIAEAARQRAAGQEAV